jgi:hypothetical protein
VDPYEAICYSGSWDSCEQATTRWFLQKVPGTTDRFRLVPEINPAYVMSPYRVLALAEHEVDGKTHFRLEAVPNRQSTFYIVIAHEKKCLTPSGCTSEDNGNGTENRSNTDENMFWRFLEAPPATPPKIWTLPESLVDSGIPVLLRNKHDYLTIHQDYRNECQYPPGRSLRSWSIQTSWSHPKVPDTFHIVSANYNEKDGYLLVSSRNPAHVIACGTYTCSLSERDPSGNEDAKYFVNITPSTSTKGHFFISFPECDGKYFDGYHSTNGSISATGLAQCRTEARGLSWVFMPYTWNLGDWPSGIPEIAGVPFTLEYTYPHKPLYIGAETSAPLAPGTQLVICPYRPRLGMNYIIELAPESPESPESTTPKPPKKFRLISADNPALCLSAEGLEEDTVVTLTDQRGPSSLLLYHQYDTVGPFHFFYLQFAHSQLFLSLRASSTPEWGNPVVQDYKSDKSLWRLSHA